MHAHNPNYPIADGTSSIIVSPWEVSIMAYSLQRIYIKIIIMPIYPWVHKMVHVTGSTQYLSISRWLSTADPTLIRLYNTYIFSTHLDLLCIVVLEVPSVYRARTGALSWHCNGYINILFVHLGINIEKIMIILISIHKILHLYNS